MPGDQSLVGAFQSHLRALGVGREETHVLVALSGGCDSVVLLHLLRFAAGGLDIQVTAAHFDHRMRRSSGSDARWTAGLCTAWAVPLVSAAAVRAPRSEAEARWERYTFLRLAAAQAGAHWIATAHHADDQAETVLFRVLRGTGLHGLQGIPDRAGGIVRPLLPFWRSEIRRYARDAGLRWRRDPTNRSLAPARNRIRHSLLPQIEAHIAAGARRNLVALADHAREAERAWTAVVAAAEREVVRADGDAFLLARRPLRGYDSAIAARMLRKILRRFGIVLDRTGTRTALQFITDAPSGRTLSLPGGVRLNVEFDTVRLERPGPPKAEVRCTIDVPAAGEQGEAPLTIGGRGYRARWRGTVCEDPPAGGSEWRAALRTEGLHGPLTVRGWRPGDRMRTRGGTKLLKKLFAEHRVPRSRRPQLPVVVDARGQILWVAGLGRPPRWSAVPGDQALVLTFVHD